MKTAVAMALLPFASLPLKADTINTITVSGAYQIPFSISFSWDVQTLSIVPGTVNVSAPLVFGSSSGDNFSWETSNWGDGWRSQRAKKLLALHWIFFLCLRPCGQ